MLHGTCATTVHNCLKTSMIISRNHGERLLSVSHQGT
jgi:hypothetical protein